MDIKAYSTESAVNKAIEIFRCERKQLNIVTIRQPLSIFWGIIKRQGIYRVNQIKKRKDKKSEDVEKNDGLVEIYQGKVWVTDPIGMGGYASIVLETTDIDICINGQPVTGASFVKEDDRIEIKGKVIAPITNIDVKISSGEMKAVLKITRQSGKRYFVKDIKAGRRIYVRSSYEKIPSSGVTFEECMDCLKAANVMEDLIDREIVRKLVESDLGGSGVVAQGHLPIHGMDSKIKYLFDNNSYINPDLSTNKKVDLLDRIVIPTVKVGDILAIKSLPAIPGRDGITSTGKVLKASPGRDAPLRAGEGAIVLSNSKIVATADGRPLLNRGIVSIVPALVIPQDVDTSTGNIFFDGDVIIKGNIVNGTRVIAKGDIIVYGNVFDS